MAALFYSRVLPGKRVIMLTNDRGNLQRARAEGRDVQPAVIGPDKG